MSDYAGDTLGLERVATDSDGSMLLRLDGAYYHSPSTITEADISYSGWSRTTQQDLAADLAPGWKPPAPP